MLQVGTTGIKIDRLQGTLPFPPVIEFLGHSYTAFMKRYNLK
jgi:hypothetical protein